MLFDRPYKQEELFEEPLLFSADTSTPEALEGDDQPLIGFYTTRLVAAQTVAEAVHYVEEDLTTDEDMPQGRIYDLGCTEVQLEELDPEVREEMKSSPDVPGVFHEGAYGFFSEIEIERPHFHEH